MQNAKIIRQTLELMGFKVFGGVNAPYVWAQPPIKMDSWAFFDKLLHETHVVCTPGSGFGACGEGYIRLSAFNSYEQVETAMARFREKLTF
jgi:LL-diaminopimelate aminotransferase